jgi:hypothetical protein
MDRTPETLTQKLKRTGFIEDEDSDVESVATVSTVPTWASDKEYEVEKVILMPVKSCNFSPDT